jgi:hypothetical protein
MSFVDQKQHTATDTDVHGNWVGGIDGKYFRCYLCGHKFKVGDKYRWIMSNRQGMGNILVCDSCDTGWNTGIIDKWEQMHKDMVNKYWSFLKYDPYIYDQFIKMFGNDKEA